MTTLSLDTAVGAVAEHDSQRAVPGWVRAWLWCVAGLVILMVVVGGATRLTGSGLSITQWRPVSGALPPLSEADWASLFAQYKASPQYHLLNEGMGLAAFKAIFWWEWGHRQLGRFIGLVYIAGFLIGVLRRIFPGRLALKLAGMGILLGFQGLLGWIMVASGLKPGMTAVEPVDLAAHLLFASLFLATLVAVAVALAPAAGERREPRGLARRLPYAIVAMTLLQLVLGALVAGSHAGLIYNTWPDMDGQIAPSFGELFAGSPWWMNAFDNVSLIQLDHRIGAYILLALALWNALLWARRGSDPALSRQARLVAALVLTQAVIGIVTLVFAVPFAAALLHQFVAMLVLIAGVRLAASVWRSTRPVSVATHPLAAHVATR